MRALPPSSAKIRRQPGAGKPGRANRTVSNYPFSAFAFTAVHAPSRKIFAPVFIILRHLALAAPQPAALLSNRKELLARREAVVSERRPVPNHGSSCRGQLETGARRATFVRRPQWLVFSSSRGDRNRFLAAPARKRWQSIKSENAGERKSGR